MRTISLRRRVTLATLGLVSVTLLVLDGFVYTSLAARLDAALRERLEERAALAVELAPGLPPAALAQRLAGDGVEVTVRGSDGAVARAPSRRPGPPRPQAPPGPDLRDGPEDSPKPPRGPYRLVSLADGSSALLIARRGEIDATLSRLLAVEIIGSLAVLALLAATVSRVVRLTLRPLDRVVDTATRIADGRTDERLAPSRTDTELGRLAAAFDVMVDSLARALAAARESEERMRTFLSDASHELRTPLAGAQASAETLLREDPDRGRREQLAVEVVRLSRRGGRLVDDLLSAARLAEGLPLERERFDLARLARDEVERTRRLAPGCSVGLQGSDRLEVVGDPERVEQILANLLDNARRAGGPDGSITVVLGECDETVEVTVSDTGPGVPREDRERIFERFVRLDPSRSASGSGNGLGLSIARGFAEAHGGSLSCRDVHGGARFVLRLPRQGSTPPSAARGDRPT